MRWEEVTLGDVLKLQRGFDITKNEQRHGTVPVVSSAGVSSFHDRSMVKGPGVVVGRKGSVGKVHFIRSDFWPHDTTLWVRDYKKTEPYYASLILSSLELELYDVGASNPTLNRNHLHLIPVRIPPLPIQRRIAGILSAYDDLIEVNTRRIALLEDTARLTFEAWFGEDSSAVLMPQPLGTLASVNPEQVRPKSPPESIHYVDIASVSPGRIDSFTPMSWADAPGRARRVLRQGDVLWSCVRPNRRSYAFADHLPENAIASTGFAVLRASKVPASFLYLAVTRGEFVKYLENVATGSAYPAVKAEDFENATIGVPSDDELKAFEQIVAPWLAQIDILHRQNTNLRAQRDLLLPKLISGEIDVSEAEDIAAPVTGQAA